jgi:hypothetical protein
MLLTALAVVVGASVMLADPIFQGLAISLMAGEIASLLISRMAVPVLYFMTQNRATPLHQSRRKILPVCLPRNDSHIEENQSLPSIPVIPGSRFPDVVPIPGNENNRTASDLAAVSNSR